MPIGIAATNAFLIADEIFVAYPMEPTHSQIFIAQLITLLALYLLK